MRLELHRMNKGIGMVTVKTRITSSLPRAAGEKAAVPVRSSGFPSPPLFLRSEKADSSTSWGRTHNDALGQNKMLGAEGKAVGEERQVRSRAGGKFRGIRTKGEGGYKKVLCGL